MPDVSVVPDVRVLDAEELGVGYTARATSSHGSSAPDAPLLQSNDPRVIEIARLLRKYGGVILTGPPGTSKSWLAGQLGDLISEGNDERRADVQFHASYQYEDFMEGYRPDEENGGFIRRDGVLMRLADLAEQHPDKEYVLVIDELSRADVGRVFGEALTYVERSKRGLEFDLPSGERRKIPLNLLVIATMNPLDRGVDEVDAAFERRFAKFDMPPDPETLEMMLNNRGVDPELIRRLLAWFRRLLAKSKQTPAAAIGHAYFSDVVDADSLRDVWKYQLKYAIERAFRFEPETATEMTDGWNRIFANLDPTPAEDAPAPAETEAEPGGE